MNNKNYYKEDLCDGDGNCKLYNPLLTQGQCKYLNEWYEQRDKIEELEKELKKTKFTLWKMQQGYQNEDEEILKKIFDAMDEDDKKNLEK